MVPAFEKVVSEYCDSKYAFAVNSATSALHISCLALGVGKGDIVWTSPISFVASSNCAIYCGAIVDFIDIDSTTYNMSVSALEDKLIKSEKLGRLPKVVIPVHLAGQSCEMDKIHALGKKYGFKIIEDASHAIGGKYKNKPIGGCQFSDITVFSFHPVKIITTGEGGMCLTNNPEVAIKLNRLRSHGIVRHQSEMTKISDGPWFYQQLSLGYNYRMTDIQAALGISQFKKIDEFINLRYKVVESYNKLLKNQWIILPNQRNDTRSSFHLYIIRVAKNNKEISRSQLFERLRNEGIIVNLHYIPIYKHPFYNEIGFNENEFPNAELYYEEAISLPIYSTLTNEEVIKIIEIINTPHGFQNLF
jgi:UDP-4-amino-4,6-dideoxy-N-acetyl-beta-L-altrosamine transaminase